MIKSLALILLLTLRAIGAEYSLGPDPTSYVRLELDKTGAPTDKLIRALVGNGDAFIRISAAKALEDPCFG